MSTEPLFTAAMYGTAEKAREAQVEWLRERVKQLEEYAGGLLSARNSLQYRVIALESEQSRLDFEIDSKTIENGDLRTRAEQAEADVAGLRADAERWAFVELAFREMKSSRAETLAWLIGLDLPPETDPDRWAKSLGELVDAARTAQAAAGERDGSVGGGS